jgi:tRNA-specific 2-thiouridylase
MGKEVGKKVFVGVSGGVDSSVSLAVLKDAGYDVTGVFITTWQPDFIDCTMRDERRDAIRVCASLGVPFLECDGERAYKEKVAEYMIDSYKKGETPNPDIYCNREIKFGVFMDFAKARGADCIATGHYAQNIKVGEHFELTMSKDSEKDQTYFLWKLTQNDLARTLFPIGHLTKNEVRKLAQKYDLPTAEKKDSQGVCMLGTLDMKDFLGKYIEEAMGDVVRVDGTIVGSHRGARFYTVGERHGFTVSAHTPDQKPYFIVARDIEKNILTISDEPEKIFSGTIHVTFREVNCISGTISVGDVFNVRFRHRGTLYEGSVIEVSNETLTLEFHGIGKGVDVGQSGVFYKNGTCCVGGVIAQVIV